MSTIKVMVVDDEREIAEHMSELVMDTVDECAVETFTLGSRALAHLNENFLDIVVSDIVMPVTDGFKILQYIADNSPSTEVIFLTAYMEFAFIYKANRIKQIDYIVKTEDDDTIRAVLKRTIGKVRAYQRERELIASLSPAETSRVVRGEIETVNNIKKYIDNNVNEDLTAGNIAQVFHYNPSYISRIFKYHNGETLSSYILGVKIEQARELLINTGKSVAAIAAELGYQSPQSFSRAFRQRMNISPHEYRHTGSGY